MTSPTLYLWFPGTASDALDFYQSVFGGEVTRYSYADFNRVDGPSDAVAHGQLVGAVTIYATDATGEEDALDMRGAAIALLGTADPATLTRWFDQLAKGGTVLDPLHATAWGSHDGQVRDRWGVRWLIGYEGDAPELTP
ncbi:MULTISPECIES: VOC family protein [Microbacterium]|uniref:VOC family protein n=1 Tax=Microbacterium TaxID=33882 RepID=UPI001E3DD8B2|nr:VOC family protein [Microbacterium nymphoidis]MCD2498758.1 VOC family protein [Microbacterium nymphoidis]